MFSLQKIRTVFLPYHPQFGGLYMLSVLVFACPNPFGYLPHLGNAGRAAINNHPKAGPWDSPHVDMAKFLPNIELDILSLSINSTLITNPKLKFYHKNQKNQTNRSPYL